MPEKLFLSMVDLTIQLSMEGSLNPEGTGYMYFNKIYSTYDSYLYL